MQYINTYQKHFWAINSVLMTFEAKKPINLISKLRCSNVHALKANKQTEYSYHHCFLVLNGCRVI